MVPGSGCLGSLVRGLIPFVKASPHDLIPSQRPPRTPSRWRGRSRHNKCGDTYSVCPGNQGQPRPLTANLVVSREYLWVSVIWNLGRLLGGAWGLQVAGWASNQGKPSAALLLTAPRESRRLPSPRLHPQAQANLRAPLPAEGPSRRPCPRGEALDSGLLSMIINHRVVKPGLRGVRTEV